jgi:hypothetical protein
VDKEHVQLTDYLVGTGGWAYFNIPSKHRLKAYSEVFNFVEVNYTFYEYPDVRKVEQWRRMVPEDFTFSVRCHQDLTHRIGLKPVDEAYYVFGEMVMYCGVLMSDACETHTLYRQLPTDSPLGLAPKWGQVRGPFTHRKTSTVLLVSSMS